MAARNNAPNFYQDWRSWEDINKPTRPPPPQAPNPTNAQIRQRYAATRAIPYAARANFLTPKIPGILLPQNRPVPPAPVAIQPANAGPVAGAQFLQPVLANLPRIPGRGKGSIRSWKAVKFLGGGIGGNVVLWRWTSKTNVPDSNGVSLPFDIAVKTALNPLSDLSLEGGLMQRFQISEHIAKLLVPPQVMTDRDCANAGVPSGGPAAGGWTGTVRRLYMEYYSQGDLHDQWDQRWTRGFPYKEMTLWHIFECLLQGISVLTYGTGEIGYHRPTSQAVEPAFDPAADVMVHFDLKPENVMIGGDRNATHPDSPPKLADFGLAIDVPGDPASALFIPGPTWNDNQLNRSRGTPTYYAPEQFTPRWNYADYAASPVCGRYGTATNVWGIGVIMYEITCLYQVNSQVPEAGDPFLPENFLINGDFARGPLFGTELQQLQSYSTALRDLIHECLYEDPAHRPSLLQLKNRIRAGVNACRAAGETVDEWWDLDAPDPETV
ncbi:unnamed protein product [Diplocarpon coronariae]|uniref:Protein kinase domain-containing protein n=1 Tax=Diplocarpon coronariae TaxID=2795749 RepID=A0A218YU15_9HELO|nr:hypothetical protein B2J93_7121 [Marssonina coronariae]